MSQIFYIVYLRYKIIHCLSEIHTWLDIVRFPLLKLAAVV